MVTQSKVTTAWRVQAGWPHFGQPLIHPFLKVAAREASSDQGPSLNNSSLYSAGAISTVEDGHKKILLSKLEKSMNNFSAPTLRNPVCVFHFEINILPF